MSEEQEMDQPIGDKSTKMTKIFKCFSSGALPIGPSSFGLKKLRIMQL
jgi:hypothetical protein